MNKGDHHTTLPLSPKVLHILMALASEPMNGYRLGLRVEETSEASNGRGQRFYSLTGLGMDVLKAEVGRLSNDVSLARSILASSS